MLVKMKLLCKALVINVINIIAVKALFLIASKLTGYYISIAIAKCCIKKSEKALWDRFCVNYFIKKHFLVNGKPSNSYDLFKMLAKLNIIGQN